MFGKKKLLTKYKWFFIILTIFFIFMGLAVISYILFEKKYENKIYPGVSVGNIYLGGLNKEEAAKKLNKSVDRINQHGITFKYKKHQTSLFPVVASLETDMAYEIITFDANNSIKKAFNFAREGKVTERILKKYKSFSGGQKFNMSYIVNTNEVNKFLGENFSQLEKPAKDAGLKYIASKNIFEIEEDENGEILNYSQTIAQLKYILDNLEEKSIEMSSQVDYPEILKNNCLNIKSGATQITMRSPLKLKYKQRTWTIGRTQLADWLILKTSADSERGNIIKVGLDNEKIKRYLEEKIAAEINEDATDSKFDIKDGKVIEFQQSKDGLELAIKETAQHIESELIINKTSKIDLVIKELKSTLLNEEIDEFGIKEILGVGHSNFAGSPKNRRENIRIGAEAVNGSLVKPGEEFSLMGTLGEINGEAGYVPELVIKNNKTIAEYGGGLCQIGTTVFRATYKSGLPVTLRRNHSYRVGYYEPAGTDATIYDPWPDYRFKNDTEKHVLIQSRIEGDDIYFTFWGTSDGRVATSTYPVITNIVRPAPTKMIETTELPVGKKKCTESAHNGADASFDYSVTYPDGEIVDTTFESHYIPWRAVCLIGVDELTVDKEEREAEEAEAKKKEEELKDGFVIDN